MVDKCVEAKSVAIYVMIKFVLLVKIIVVRSGARHNALTDWYFNHGERKLRWQLYIGRRICTSVFELR